MIMNALAEVAEKRTRYEQCMMSLVAAGRALSNCSCWHHDHDRAQAVASLGEYIRDTANSMADLLKELQALEARVIGA